MVIEGQPLSVLVVSQYFSPEAFGVNALVAELQERGHSVTVLTGMPNYPSGTFADGLRRLESATAKLGRTRALFRIPLFARGQNSRLRLAMNYLSFAINASVLAPFFVKSRPDAILVYQMSPITMALPAVVVKLFTHSKILLWVQDIWPESLVATGAVKNRVALITLRLMVRVIYRYSSVIAVQSRQFEKFIRPLALAASDIRYLPNTADRFYRTDPSLV